MSNLDEANDFLSGGNAKYFKFENVGDTVRGEVVAARQQQQTTLEGDPLFWANGDKRMELKITLQTDLRDDDQDDGLRDIYVRGGKYSVATGKGTASAVAIADAFKAAGEKGLAVGGTLALQHSGLGVAERGKSAPKLYIASYKGPVTSISLDELG